MTFYPSTYNRYLSLGRSAQVHHYGVETPRQTVEIHRCGVPGAPVLVFMHGGACAWGRSPVWLLADYFTHTLTTPLAIFSPPPFP